MKISNKIIIACLFCFTMTSCFKDNVITPSSKISSEFYALDLFEKLEVSDNFKVYIKYGDHEDIEIIANDNLHNHLIVDVVGKTLKIGTYNVNIWGDETLEAYITTPFLDNFRVSGNSTVELLDFLETDELLIRLSGNSKFYGEFEADIFDIDASGNSKAEVMGYAIDSEMRLSGNSKFEDFDFETEILDARLSGNSKAYITVLETIYYRGAGNSKLYYRGNPDIGREVLSGNSRLIRD